MLISSIDSCRLVASLKSNKYDSYAAVLKYSCVLAAYLTYGSVEAA